MRPIGSEFKLRVHVEPIDGLYMDDYDFECELYTNLNKKIKILKNDTKREDHNNYIVIVTSDISKQLGKGILKMRFTAHVPDTDFTDGIRTEIVELCTNITIV